MEGVNVLAVGLVDSTLAADRHTPAVISSQSQDYTCLIVLSGGIPVGDPAGSSLEAAGGLADSTSCS